MDKKISVPTGFDRRSILETLGSSNNGVSTLETTSGNNDNCDCIFASDYK